MRIRSRAEIWATVRELVAGGTTALLTTQYLEEADRIADDVVIINHGRAVTRGTPQALKANLGVRVDVTVATSGDVANAVHVLGAWTETEPDVDADLLRITAVATGRDVTVPELVRALDSGDVAVRDVGVREPSLDEVFLHLVDASTGEVAA